MTERSNKINDLINQLSNSKSYFDRWGNHPCYLFNHHFNDERFNKQYYACLFCSKKYSKYTTLKKHSISDHNSYLKLKQIIQSMYDYCIENEKGMTIELIDIFMNVKDNSSFYDFKEIMFGMMKMNLEPFIGKNT